MIRSVRCIATGFSPPTPVWNGESRKCSRSSISTITDVTDPIIMACVNGPSPLSAKNSMYTKITPEMKNSTIQSGVGITPTAPWMRSLRAASRSEV